MFKLHREIWRIIDYKDFYDKAPQRTVPSMLTSLFAVGRIPPYFSRVPRGTLANIQCQRTMEKYARAFLRGGKREKKTRDILRETRKKEIFCFGFLSRFLSKKAD